MALVYKDRVLETSTTTGTGAFTLAGTLPSFQTFAAIGDGNTCYYTITAGSEWEVGLGTYTASGTSLSRDVVLDSSNSGSLVNFAAGTKTVFVTFPADVANTAPKTYPSAGIAVSTGSAWGTSKTTPTGDVVGTTDTQTLTNKTINGTNNTITNVSLTTGVTGTLPVANGGTGSATLTANNVLLGNGTSALQVVAPGTSGNLLTSNGTTWVSEAPPIITDKIQPITASVDSGALTITLNPTTLDFRDATLGSGTVNTRTVSAAISVVVSSGSTLGTINAVQNRLAVLAIDNAGTVELAVVNLAGGVNLDETGVISTTAEGGAGGADSANVVYSTTARTNVPYRVVGFVESTQATAGTWATAPSKIQGYGGQAFAVMSSLGYGQSWSNATASRALATVYYNTTGKPISVSIVCSFANSQFNLEVDGVVACYEGTAANTGVHEKHLAAIVPPGSTYQLIRIRGASSFTRWNELR